MAIHIKKVAFLAFAVLAGAACLGPARSQPATQPKLTIGWVQFNSLTPDGYYNATVGINLERTNNNPQVSFNLNFTHVRTLDEVYSKLKPAVDQLADELKAASDHFEPPH